MFLVSEQIDKLNFFINHRSVTVGETVAIPLTDAFGILDRLGIMELCLGHRGLMFVCETHFDYPDAWKGGWWIFRTKI